MMGPLVRVIHKEVRAVHAFFEAGFHNLLAVAIEERYAKEGMRAALGLLGTGQLSLTKCVVLVDADVDVKDWRAVFGAIREHFDPEDDFLLLPGVPLDTLDFTSMRMNLGLEDGARRDGQARRRPRRRAHARRARGRARRRRAAPAAACAPRSAASRRRRAARSPRATCRAGSPACARRASSRRRCSSSRSTPTSAGARWSRRSSPTRCSPASRSSPRSAPTCRSTTRCSLLWGIFTRFDAARDVVFTDVTLHGAWPSARGRMGIDATWKAGYPEPVVMPEEVSPRRRPLGRLWR